MCLITESTQQRLVIPLYRGEHEIDIFQFWKTRGKTKKKKAKPLSDDLMKITKDGVQPFIDGINQVLEKYRYSQMNTDTVMAMREDLRRCGLNNESAEYTLDSILSRERGIMCDSITIEMSQPEYTTFYDMAEPFPRRMLRPRPAPIIKPNFVTVYDTNVSGVYH